MSTALSSVQVADRANISYRQLDHWTSRGYLKARRGLSNPGHGIRRQYTKREAEVAEHMARLVHDGVAPDRAARAARDLAARGETVLGGALLQIGGAR